MHTRATNLFVGGDMPEKGVNIRKVSLAVVVLAGHRIEPKNKADTSGIAELYKLRPARHVEAKILEVDSPEQDQKTAPAGGNDGKARAVLEEEAVRADAPIVGCGCGGRIHQHIPGQFQQCRTRCQQCCILSCHPQSRQHVIGLGPARPRHSCDPVSQMWV